MVVQPTDPTVACEVCPFLDQSGLEKDSRLRLRGHRANCLSCLPEGRCLKQPLKRLLPGSILDCFQCVELQTAKKPLLWGILLCQRSINVGADISGGLAKAGYVAGDGPHPSLKVGDGDAEGSRYVPTIVYNGIVC